MGNPSLLKAVEEAEKCGTSRLLEVHYRIYYAFNLLVLVEQLEGAPFFLIFLLKIIDR
jgi:hypothetical protein